MPTASAKWASNSSASLQRTDNRSPRSPRQRRMFLEDEVLHVSCGFFTCLVVVKKADVLPLLPYTSCAFVVLSLHVLPLLPPLTPRHRIGGMVRWCSYNTLLGVVMCESMRCRMWSERSCGSGLVSITLAANRPYDRRWHQGSWWQDISLEHYTHINDDDVSLKHYTHQCAL